MNADFRTHRNTWVNIAAAAAGFGVLATGAILWLAVGRGPGTGKIFLDWHRHQWGDLHLACSLVFTGLLLVHLLLHWRWMVNVMPRHVGGKGWLRAAAVTGLTVALIAIAFALLADPAYEEGGAGRAEGRGAGNAAEALSEDEVRDDTATDALARPVRRRNRGGRGGVLAVE